MKKLSLKIRLKNRDDFEQKLSIKGFDFGPVFFQHDRIYLPRGYKRNQSFPRLILRTEMHAIDRPARYFLILKRHIEDSDVEIENKTPISDYLETSQIAMQLGFELFAEVSRKRQELKLKDGSLVFLDKIEGLSSSFAKLEVPLSKDQIVSIARTSAANFFHDLEEKSFVEETYAELLNKPLS